MLTRRKTLAGANQNNCWMDVQFLNDGQFATHRTKDENGRSQLRQSEISCGCQSLRRSIEPKYRKKLSKNVVHANHQMGLPQEVLSFDTRLGGCEHQFITVENGPYRRYVRITTRANGCDFDGTSSKTIGTRAIRRESWIS